MPVTIRPALPADLPSIVNVNQQAFSSPGEARLVELLHERSKATVSLLAELDGQVVGHVLFSPIRFDPPQPDLKSVGLAPMAVLPAYQRQGIGSQLARAGIQACRAAGLQAIVVLGDPAYYGRFGFQRASDFGLGNEYQVQDEFMVMELQVGALQGVHAIARYTPEFQEIGV